MVEVKKEDLRSYRRRKSFDLELTPLNDGEPDEITISITHNGRQWSSISLTPIERLKVIKSLLEFEEEK